MPYRPIGFLASAAMLTLGMSGCSGPTEFEYTCHDAGRTVTEGPLLERVKAMAVTTETDVLDSCDSGEPLYVIFEAADSKNVMDEPKAAGCRQVPLDESVEDAGNVLRCDFDFGETEFWVSADSTQGHVAQLRVPD